jgi:HK97 family phage major capsid protein
LTISVWDLIAQARVGQDELADSDADIAGLLQFIVGEQFGMMEDDAFANGTGTSQPWGLAKRSTASGLITQGLTAATTNTITADELKKLPFQVPSRFRDNGAYFFSNDAAQAASLLKDSTSQYLWQPNNQAGQPASLFGYRAYTLEGLPAMTATTTSVDPSIIFGDPSLGYMIAQRQQITMQRLDERYAELGLVGFIFKMRVGGDVIRPTAFARILV